MEAFNIVHSIAELDNENWETHSKDNKFLSTSFLHNFEQLDNTELLPFYISNKEMIIYGHLITIKGRKVANYWNKSNGFSLKKNLLKIINFKFFCFGNTHLSNVSSCSANSTINFHKIRPLFEQIKKDFKVNFFLLPDHFYQKMNTKHIKSSKMTPLTIDPDMVLEISSKWSSFNDYQLAVQSKYKKRIRKVFKNSALLTIERFSKEQLKKQLPTMERLYENVYKKSSFSGPKFDINIYKQFLDNDHFPFFVHGFFHEKELIGFSSDFFVDNVLHSYFIGLDYRFNEQFDLYNRILYFTIEMAIKLKANKIKFGRTAAEFKSTIGAAPINSTSGVHIESRFLNWIFKPMIKRIEPKQWIQRNPFKTA